MAKKIRFPLEMDYDIDDDIRTFCNIVITDKIIDMAKDYIKQW